MFDEQLDGLMMIKKKKNYMSSSGLIGVFISYKNNTKPLITRSQEARFNKDDLSCTTEHTNIMIQSNLTPASLRESITAFTFP